MTKVNVPKVLLWDYQYVVPFLLICLTLESARASASSSYDFPGWGIGVGWILALTSTAPIGVYALDWLIRNGLSARAAPPSATVAPVRQGPPAEHTPAELQISGLSTAELQANVARC